MYNGKECCIGCGKSGIENPRRLKSGLCDTCRELLKLGKELKPDFKPQDYIYVMATWYKMRFYNDEHGGSDIEAAIFALMDLAHRDIPSYAGIMRLTDIEATIASKNVIVRKDFAEALKKLVDALQAQQAEVREMYDNVERERKLVVKNERNKIYNEGVKYGRSLLIQLNNGELSLSELDKEIVKYE